MRNGQWNKAGVAATLHNQPSRFTVWRLLFCLAQRSRNSPACSGVSLRPLISFCLCCVEGKKTESTNMNPRKTTIATLAALSVSLALADDFKTIRGKEYKNATINRVEPDGLVLRTKSGISKVYFTELPQDVQERFHYNAQQAAQFTSQTIEEVRLAQQQKIAADNNRAAEIAKNLALVRQQEEAEIQRQHEAKMQRQRMESQQHHRVQTNTQPTYSRSQEGIPEHTYELTQDYKIDFGGLTIRFRRGERYHGRILVDHAEIDRDGRSYTVPSGILRRVN